MKIRIVQEILNAALLLRFRPNADFADLFLIIETGGQKTADCLSGDLSNNYSHCILREVVEEITYHLGHRLSI